MRQGVTVKYVDGREFEGEAGPRQFTEFERQYDASVQDLVSNARLEWIYFIAWQVAKKVHAAGEHPGSIPATFDGFLDLIDDVTLIGDVAPLDETVS